MLKHKKWLWLLGGLFLVCSTGLFILIFFNFINFRPFAVSCLDSNDIDHKDRISIEAEAIEILKLIASEQSDQVWNNSHPAFREEITEEQSIALGRELSRMLVNVDKAKLFDTRLVTLHSTDTSKTNVVCGLLDTDSPTHLKVQTLINGSKFAITQIKLPDKPFGRTVSIQMAEHEGKFKLVSLETSLYDYKGKQAEYYEQLGDKWVDQEKLLEGYLAYQFGTALSHRGSFLQTGQDIRLNKKVKELSANNKLQDELKNWTVNGTDYRIILVGLLTTLGDANMYVKYLSYKDLESAGTEQEAALLMKYVEEEYPDLSTEFDGVLFEAFNVLPRNPNEVYSTYRVPINFGEVDKKGFY